MKLVLLIHLLEEKMVEQEKNVGGDKIYVICVCKKFCINPAKFKNVAGRTPALGGR